MEYSSAPETGQSGTAVALKRYSVLLSPAPEGGYTVRVPTLPGCNTQGDTFEEAIANAREAVAGYIDALKELGRPIPEEIGPVQAIVIDVAA